ncbi:hypothetical protein T265_15207, partial [Opisthorchis viverrini]
TFDIALLKLSTPLDLTRPNISIVNLPTAQNTTLPQLSETGVIAGFGYFLHPDMEPTIAQLATLKFVAHQICAQRHGVYSPTYNPCIDDDVTRPTFDITLLKLSTPLDLTRPNISIVNLPTAQNTALPQLNETGVIAGFGYFLHPDLEKTTAQLATFKVVTTEMFSTPRSVQSYVKLLHRRRCNKTCDAVYSVINENAYWRTVKLRLHSGFMTELVQLLARLDKLLEDRTTECFHQAIAQRSSKVF